MLKIVRTPKKLQPFFTDLLSAGLLTSSQAAHVTAFVIGLLVTGFRRTVTGISRAIYQGVHRVKRNEFLTHSDWDEAALQTYKTWGLLRRLGLREGKTLHLILDDTHTRKRGKKMQGTGKYRDMVSGAFVWGHNIVVGVFYFAGFVLPYQLKVHLKPEQAQEFGEKFQTLPQAAAEIIRGLQLATGVRVIVLFDAGYMNKAPVRACLEKGLTYVSTLPANRNIRINGRLTKVGAYRSCIPHSHHRAVTIRTARSGRRKTYWATHRDARLPSLGRVTVVFSRRAKFEKALPIVTNDRTMSRQQIIQTYEIRFLIELFFKDAKSGLGLGEYQTTKLAGAVKHLHLVTLAYSLLVERALDAWEREPIRGTRRTKRGKRNGVLGVWSLLDLREEVRDLVLDDLLDYLLEESDPKRAIRELREILTAG
jgi:SRSO17 transposase